MPPRKKVLLFLFLISPCQSIPNTISSVFPRFFGLGIVSLHSPRYRVGVIRIRITSCERQRVIPLLKVVFQDPLEILLSKHLVVSAFEAGADAAR